MPDTDDDTDETRGIPLYREVLLWLVVAACAGVEHVLGDQLIPLVTRIFGA